MLTAVLHEPRRILLDQAEAPHPAPGQVQVRIRAGGICGSDLSYYFKGKSGDFAMRDPFILGHEAAGDVSALGEGVTTLRVGQRVAINPAQHCGACRFCLRGMTNHCLNMRFFGSASVYPHMQGMFREFLTVAAAQCFPVPDTTGYAEAAMAEPLAVTLHALRHAGTLLGAHLLVVGCGPIGCMLVAVARRAGAHRIVATDLAPEALDMATRLGADQTALPNQHDWSHNRGTFDVVIEASGSPHGLDTALRSVRAGGAVIQVGNLPPGPSQVSANLIMAKEIRYQGSFRFAEEYPLAVQEILSHKIDLSPLRTHTFPLADVNRAFEVAQDRTQSMKVHLLFQ